MDQLFERFERLIRSWVNSTIDASAAYDGGTAQARRRSSSGDPDLDAAMAELDDFLDTSRTETERRESAERRAEEESARKARERQRAYGGGGAGTEHFTETQQKRALSEAYRYLGVPDGAPFADVKSAYKKLLLKYHPDRNSQTPDALRASTERSARINAAYQLIEAWEETRARPR